MNIESASIFIHSRHKKFVRVGNYYIVKSFPIRELLGDMYNKYNKFKFIITNFWEWGFGNPGSSINISGLDWEGLKNENSRPRMNYFGGFGTAIYNTKYGLVFNKPSTHTVDLTLIFQKNYTDEIYYQGTLFAFTVVIYGIVESPLLLTYNNPINSLSSSFLLDSRKATININNYGGEITFKNVKIKELLGDMYDKYDKFKLILTNMYSVPFNPIAPSDRRLVGIKVKGLPFPRVYEYSIMDQYFPHPYKTIPTLGIIEYPTSNHSTNIFYGEWGVDFDKPSNPTVDLTIYIYTIQNSTVFTNTINYFINVYNFTVLGIE